MVVVVLLLLVEDLQLQEELLLLEELRVGRVHLGRTLFVCFLVGRDVLVVLQLLHLHPRDQQVKTGLQSFLQDIYLAVSWPTKVKTFKKHSGNLKNCTCI